MSWNLKAHILDHSAATQNKLGTKRTFDENDPNNQHFTFSCDVASLIVNHSCKNQKDIDKVMTAFMDDLVSFNSEPYRESKGRNKKTGEKVYRNVEFNFNDALLAYHNSASDSSNSNNYSVNPHFHALFHKSQKIGRGFKYLREAIDEVSKKHNIVCNFQEETGKPKIDSKGATDLTWFVKRSSDKDFRRRIEDGWVKRALIDFQNHYKQTGNLMYLLKGYKDLEMKLKRLKISHDLDFSLNLTAEQKDTIQVLYSGDKKKIIHLINDRQNHIARGYFEHSYGFSNIIIDEIQKRSGIQIPIVKIDPSELSVEIKRKEVNKDNSSKFNKTLAYAHKSDLEIAMRYARNEKEFKALMIKLGYTQFAFKVKNISGKRERVGFIYLNSGKTRTVFFNQLKTDMGNIRAALMANSKNSTLNAPKDLKSYLKSYEPLPQNSYPDKLFEEIYDLKSTLSLKGFFVKQLDSNVVEFKAKKTYILDLGNRIELKTHRKEDLGRNVQIIADMVEAKGLAKYNISGTTEFKIAMKAELKRREENRSLQVNQVLLSEESMDALKKVYDEEKAEELQLPTEDDVLKELSDMHLSKISIDDGPEAYKKLFSMRAKALDKKDLTELLRTYEVLPPIDSTEMREKILSLAKCLNMSSHNIFLEISSDLGFQEHEIEAFKDVITESDDYGKTFLRKFIIQLEEQLRQALVLDSTLSNNQLERNIALLESLLKEMDEFQGAYLNKQEYIQKIEDINTAISSSSFYEAQILIDGLDDEMDKHAFQEELSEKIDLAAAELDFEKLKDNVEAEMNSTVSYEIEDDSNHQTNLN